MAKSRLRKKMIVDNQDLGFGSKVSQQSRQRFLNRDGSFNVVRKGMPIGSSLNAYHNLIEMPWWKFHLALIAIYLGINFFFAVLYFLAGADALAGVGAGSPGARFIEVFFFSVQTFTTLGYGSISPTTLLANIFTTMESFTGLLGFALATGLLFARFSRPTAEIIFSENALISPYQDITGLMFRITNARRNQLVDLNVRVILGRLEKEANGEMKRRFHNLELERKYVAFFPLTWTIVHPIDEKSPLNGISKEEFDKSDAEILILLSAFDETFSTTVHTRSSYKPEEIIWGKKFVPLLETEKTGHLSVDVRKLGEWE